MSTDSSPTPYRRGRRTLYRGVMMRSRTEARFAAQLDEMGAEWKYEPYALAGPSGQWLPDFEVDLDTRYRTLVDVKPTRDDVLSNIEHWWRVATEAMPGQEVQVVGAGFMGAFAYYEADLVWKPGEGTVDTRRVLASLEAIACDGDTIQGVWLRSPLCPPRSQVGSAPVRIIHWNPALGEYPFEVPAGARFCDCPEHHWLTA
jgi:hypothetical protein